MNSIEKFNQLDDLNNKFKSLLEQDFGRLYLITTKKSDDASDSSEASIDYLNYFAIKLVKTGFFPAKLNSQADLNELKNKILKRYAEFIIEFHDYSERALPQIKQTSTHHVKSLAIIFKQIKNRQKNFEAMINRFTPKDEWNLDKTAENFCLENAKFFSDLLSSIIPSISSGIIELPFMYQQILNLLNSMLLDFGISTREIKADTKLTSEEEWYWVDPQISQNDSTSNVDLKDTIKQVLSLPYQLGSDVRVLAGQVVLWAVKA